MNKNLVIILLVGVGAIGVIGAGVLQAVRPDATATFTDHVFSTLQYLVSAVVIVYGLRKVGEKVDQAVKNTNGNLEKRDVEIARLQQLALDAGADPQTITGTQPVQEP